MEPDLWTFVEGVLRIPPNSEPMHSGFRVDGSLGVPDAVWVVKGRAFVVEVKRGVATMDAVGHLALLKKGFAIPGKKVRVTPVLVTWSAPPAVRQALNLIGGILVEAPAKLLSPAHSEVGSFPISSEKSWKVIEALLENRAVKSYRQLAVLSGASLGWAHRVALELSGWGIADIGKGGIRLLRPEKLLDIVPMERPLRSLFTEEVEVDFTSANGAAVEITRILDRAASGSRAPRFAFTANTAAALYTSYSFRQDRLDIYADPDDLMRSKSPRTASRKVKVRTYRPDRDVFGSSRILKGIRVVSRGQTLLDLAGMGFEASDLALKVIHSYAA